MYQNDLRRSGEALFEIRGQCLKAINSSSEKRINPKRQLTA